MMKFLKKYGAMISCWLFAAGFVLLGLTFAAMPGKSRAADDEIPVAGEWVNVISTLPTDFSSSYIWYAGDRVFFTKFLNNSKLTYEFNQTTKIWLPITITGIGKFDSHKNLVRR